MSFIDRTPLPSLGAYATRINRTDILDYPLSKFIVNSSHNSYLASRQVFSNPTTQNVVDTLKGGARCIELDIHNRSNEPVVMHSGGALLNYQYANLNNVVSGIQQNAFKTTADPMIIFLEIFNGDNEIMIQNLVKSLRQYLGDRLYVGNMERVLAGAERNFMEIPIRQLFEKVILVSNYFFENGDNVAISEKTKANRTKYLYPIVHGLTNSWGLDAKSVTDPRVYQRGFSTRVYPYNITTSSNFDPTPYFLLDYTFVCMNFGSSDTVEMTKNTRMFQHSNIVPKNSVFADSGAILNPTASVSNTPVYENATDRLSALHTGVAFRNYTWISENGYFRLVMQPDGNLVIYDQRTNSPKWASGTVGNPNAVVIMQIDGNLVIYRASGSPIWATGTNNSTYAGGFARIANDGTVELVGITNTITKAK